MVSKGSTEHNSLFFFIISNYFYFYFIKRTHRILCVMNVSFFSLLFSHFFYNKLKGLNLFSFFLFTFIYFSLFQKSMEKTKKTFFFIIIVFLEDFMYFFASIIKKYTSCLENFLCNSNYFVFFCDNLRFYQIYLNFFAGCINYIYD